MAKNFVERQPMLCPSCNHYNHNGDVSCEHELAEGVKCICTYGAPLITTPPVETVVTPKGKVKFAPGTEPIFKKSPTDEDED